MYGIPLGAHDERDERERPLRDGLIELRPRGAGRTEVPDVADDTHNRHPRAVVVEAHAASDRILSGPLIARERLVDEHDGRRVARVAEAEVASGLDRNAHRVEVARHHDLIAGVRHRLRLRPPLDQVAGAKVVAADRQRHGGARGANAWHRPRVVRARPSRTHLTRLIFRARAADADVERQQVACVDAGVDARQRNEASDQQRRADEQHERDRDLGDDQRVARPARAARPAGPGAAFSERVGQAVARQLKRGDDAERHANGERDRHVKSSTRTSIAAPTPAKSGGASCRSDRAAHHANSSPPDAPATASTSDSVRS